jgi:hypothetical protein
MRQCTCILNGEMCFPQLCACKLCFIFCLHSLLLNKCISHGQNHGQNAYEFQLHVGQGRPPLPNNFLCFAQSQRGNQPNSQQQQTTLNRHNQFCVHLLIIVHLPTCRISTSKYRSTKSISSCPVLCSHLKSDLSFIGG